MEWSNQLWNNASNTTSSQVAFHWPNAVCLRRRCAEQKLAILNFILQLWKNSSLLPHIWHIICVPSVTTQSCLASAPKANTAHCSLKTIIDNNDHSNTNSEVGARTKHALRTTPMAAMRGATTTSKIFLFLFHICLANHQCNHDINSPYADMVQFYRPRQENLAHGHQIRTSSRNEGSYYDQ